MSQTDAKFRFLSVTGYLGLYHKGLFRREYRRYWFWFDEQSCSLKYFKNQETYRQCLHDPLGCIDMRYAKVTPPMALQTGANNEFQINSESQVYTLAAETPDSAHDWIKKLQDKREEWIKVESAKEANTDGKKRTMMPLHQRPGAVLAPTPEEDETEGSPSTVRRIISSKILSSSSRHSAKLLQHSDHFDRFDRFDPRRLTEPSSSFVENRSSSRPKQIPVQRSMSDSEEATTKPASQAELRKSRTPEPYDDRPASANRYTSLPMTLSKEERDKLQLEHDFHQSREDVTRMHKEVMRLQDKLEKRDQEIVKLNKELAELKEESTKSRHRPQDNLREENESYKDIIEQYKRSTQNLVDEINLHKLHDKEHERRISMERHKVAEVERELMQFKAKYVLLLSDRFKITIPNPAGAQEDEIDPEEEENSNELLWLLKQEGGDNPVFESYKSKFEDEYGDLHDWQGGTPIQHYLCRQLYTHYTQHVQEARLQEWEDYLSQVKHRTKPYWDLPVGSDRTKKREFRNLLRKGIPIQYRAQVWTSLVYRLMSKTKEVKDAAAGKGNSYYQSLLQSKGESTSAEKQIQLDLFRTLPSNRHFKIGGQGAPKLENILVAFSRHNKNVGYCQGMNMLVAISLLFLDEETAFWFLAAIIEKLLPRDYYTPGLLGAQADQAVVRELVAEKLPRLNAHLQQYSIDVTLVTFNWFLTLFVDALPTESVLRILDCFLFEGMKVLFRMTLGILRVNERRVLNLTDPVALFQFLKEVARHTFDMEAVFSAAFQELEPFPSRHFLSTRQHNHYSKIKVQWTAREKEREQQAIAQKKTKGSLSKQTQLSLLASSFASREQQPQRHLVWECGCVRGTTEAWLACGERQQGRIGIVSVDGGLNMEIPNTDVGSRVICIRVLPCDLVLLGTLDFSLHAIDCKTRKEVWSIKMNDSVLDIVTTDDCTIFAALADGFVAVLHTVSANPPDSPPILIRIGSTAVPCIELSNEELWCGCGKSITVMCARTYEPVQSLVIEDSLGKLYKMEEGKHGIWASFRSSTVVCLFDVEHYVKLLQIDYTALLVDELPAGQNPTDYRITSLLPIENYLWLGAGNGTVHIFSIAANVPNPRQRIRQMVKQSSEAREPTDQPQAHQSGGLLSKATVDGTSSTVKERQFKPTSRTDYYNKRRKTTFGQTLRRDIRGESTKVPRIFKLILEKSNRVVESPNEAVRVILPLSHEEDCFAVSCVHSLTEGQKTVQVWKCPPAEGPSTWVFGYLPSYEMPRLQTEDEDPATELGKVPTTSPPPGDSELKELSTVQEQSQETFDSTTRL